jgi:hypothetical protein
MRARSILICPVRCCLHGSERSQGAISWHRRLVEIGTKRDNIGLRLRDLDVTKVSPTRLSRPRQGPRHRRSSAEAIRRAAGQEGDLWSARAADAGHPYGLALRAMRHPAGIHLRTDWQMSEVQLRTALLPAVHLFRYFQPVRMHAAHPRTGRAERRAQSMYVLFHAGPGGKGNLDAKFGPPRGCANRIRESLQEVIAWPDAVVRAWADLVSPAARRRSTTDNRSRR